MRSWPNVQLEINPRFHTAQDVHSCSKHSEKFLSSPCSLPLHRPLNINTIHLHPQEEIFNIWEKIFCFVRKICQIEKDKVKITMFLKRKMSKSWFWLIKPIWMNFSCFLNAQQQQQSFSSGQVFPSLFGYKKSFHWNISYIRWKSEKLSLIFLNKLMNELMN